MAWTAITAAETDQNSPLDQALMDKLRLNDADHETRVGTLEDATNISAFSHFAQRHFFGDNTAASPDNVLVTSGGVDGAYEEKRFPEPFYLALFAGRASGDFATASIVNRIGVVTDEHFLRIDLPSDSGSSSTDTHFGMIMARPAFVYDNRVKPITFTARLRLATAASRRFHCGLTTWVRLESGAGRPILTDRIALERNGANWRFVTSSGGATTNGTDITPDSNNAWFEVKILFEAGPQARCYLKKSTDGDFVLKETFTTNLPTAAQLHGMALTAIVAQTDVASDLDLDYMKIYAAGALGNAA